MKFSFLKQIVNEAAHQLKENAAYAGACDDGGCSSLLSRFNDYQNNMVIKLAKNIKL